MLLASCVGDEDTGGGLFAIDSRGVEEIDRLSTLGINVYAAPDGEPKFVRALRSADNLCSELMVYDSAGVQCYHRLDGISDIHDVMWDGSEFVVVSTGTNAVAWISPAGKTVRIWQPPADPKDSWHLNSLYEIDGRLLVFGISADFPITAVGRGGPAGPMESSSTSPMDATSLLVWPARIIPSRTVRIG